MRIVHWDEMFHPTFGYQINVLAKYQAIQGHEVIILTGEHPENHPTFKGLFECDVLQMDAEYSKKYNVRIIRLPIYRVVSGMVLYRPGFLKRIKELKPDVLMCHTNDTISGMIVALSYRYLNMPIVFDNHMLEMAAVNPLHKLFTICFRFCITPIIKRNNWTVIRTQDDPYVYDAYRIPLEQAPFISFGSDLTIFHPDDKVRAYFRQIHGIHEDDFVIVYTGKLSEGKGGKLLAEALRKRFQTNRNIVAVVVGTARSDYELEVEEILANSENRIIRFETQNYLNLPQFYQMADVFLCAKQCSLSFYDAQACGLPVVAEDNNVNVDRVSHQNGFTFRAGNVLDFRQKLETCMNMEDEKYEIIRENAVRFIKSEYNYADISEQYTQIMEREVKRFQRTSCKGCQHI